MTTQNINRIGQTDLFFDGPDYEKEFDQERLTGQLKKIYALMKDSKYRTLQEIEGYTGAPQSSISAQLRHLRKERFGSHVINKRRRGDRKNGLFEYQLSLEDSDPLEQLQLSQSRAKARVVKALKVLIKEKEVLSPENDFIDYVKWELSILENAT